MSGGIGHVFITIGIAEPIAIKMMVTANIFAISFPSAAASAGLQAQFASAVECLDRQGRDLTLLFPIFYFAL
jgi:hypothetical protein